MRGLLISILVLAVQSFALANQPPVANAGPDVNMYTGDTVILGGSATDPDGDFIIGWFWQAIDVPADANWTLTPETDPNPYFTANTPGDYILSLLVLDSRGAISAPDYVTIHVADNLPPVAVATADKMTVTVGEQVCFDGSQSYDPEAGVLIYYWNFGDGSDPANSATVCHTFLEQGNYIVIFGVTDVRLATDSNVIPITVNPNIPPESIPTAMPSFGEAPLTVQFAANAFDPDNDPLTYFWNFGDTLSADNNSTLENPTHLYGHKGTYRVALDVCDGLATTHRAITIRVGTSGIDYLLGDIDFDGDVDFEDVNEFVSAYLTETGDPDYNSDADLDPNDGFIDLRDFALLANDWRKFLP